MCFLCEDHFSFSGSHGYRDTGFPLMLVLGQFLLCRSDDRSRGNKLRAGRCSCTPSATRTPVKREVTLGRTGGWAGITCRKKNNKYNISTHITAGLTIIMLIWPFTAFYPTCWWTSLTDRLSTFSIYANTDSDDRPGWRRWCVLKHTKVKAG